MAYGLNFIITAMLLGLVTIGFPFLLNELTLELRGGLQLFFILIFNALLLLCFDILIKGSDAIE